MIGSRLLFQEADSVSKGARRICRAPSCSLLLSERGLFLLLALRQWTLLLLLRVGIERTNERISSLKGTGGGAPLLVGTPPSQEAALTWSMFSTGSPLSGYETHDGESLRDSKDSPPPSSETFESRTRQRLSSAAAVPLQLALNDDAFLLELQYLLYLNPDFFLHPLLHRSLIHIPPLCNT